MVFKFISLSKFQKIIKNIWCRTPSKIHWFFSFYIEVFKSIVDKEVNIGQFLNNIFQSFRLHFSGRPRLIEAALQESATLSATLIDKLCHLWHTFLFWHERHTFVATIDLISVASIHERPIFWSLATNLGTTFKAPTNLGTQKGEDSHSCPFNFTIPFGSGCHS